MQDVPYGFCRCGCGQRTTTAKRDRPERGVRAGEHYRYVQGHSSINRPILDRYVERDMGYATPCWVWTGWTPNGRYGRVRTPGGGVPAHRYFYEHFVGKIPSGLFIDHLCRVTRCVNPRHLEPVTNAENIRRAAKLTLEDAREIRRRRADGESGSSLAREFAVSPNTVCHIVKGRTWREDVAA